MIIRMIMMITILVIIIKLILGLPRQLRGGAEPLGRPGRGDLNNSEQL